MKRMYKIDLNWVTGREYVFDLDKVDGISISKVYIERVTFWGSIYMHIQTKLTILVSGEKFIDIVLDDEEVHSSIMDRPNSKMLEIEKIYKDILEKLKN